MLAAASAGTLIAVIMYGGSDKYPGRAQSFATALLTERAPDGTVRTITLKAGKNAGKSFLSCSEYRKDDPNSCSHSIWPDAKAGGGAKSAKAETQKSSGRRPGFAPKPRVFK